MSRFFIALANLPPPSTTRKERPLPSPASPSGYFFRLPLWAYVTEITLPLMSSYRFYWAAATRRSQSNLFIPESFVLSPDPRFPPHTWPLLWKPSEWSFFLSSLSDARRPLVSARRDCESTVIPSPHIPSLGTKLEFPYAPNPFHGALGTGGNPSPVRTVGTGLGTDRIPWFSFLSSEWKLVTRTDGDPLRRPFHPQLATGFDFLGKWSRLI